MTGRFAPSPTGRMHLGNIWSALLNWLSVRKADGLLLLRIEDIDTGRCRPAYTARLMEDLSSLGLNWDESPAHPVLRQQERLDIYGALLADWRAQGLVYPCVCSRQELLASSAPHPEDGHHRYDGRCRTETGRRGRNPGKPPAWRLRIPDDDTSPDSFADLLQGHQQMDLFREWGDFVVARADGQFAYQFVCAVDDALTGVDFVLRGADLLTSTFPQRHIFRLLNQPMPTYCHVPLLTDPDGIRLSKRQQSLDLGAMYESGLRAPDILGRLAHLAGWLDRPEPATARELLTVFQLETLAGKRSLAVRPDDFIHPLEAGHSAPSRNPDAHRT